jgi:regulator of sigma E protease
MLAVLGFLLTIGILVIVHEFGHYLFARLFKVKVISFSIGFGPKLLKWQGKHNQWCISAIPLGGYVQMLDEREATVSPELLPMAFNNKPPYQKLLIAFAGPLFNILFAFIAYYIMGLYGVYNLKATIQSINPTPMVQNLQQIPTNSTILSLNGQNVDSWNSAEEVFSDEIKHTSQLNLKLQIGAEQKIINLNLNKYLDNSENPSLSNLGLYPFQYLPIISYVEPQSPAAKAGLREQDKVLQINQTPIKSWFTLAEVIRESPSNKLLFSIIRGHESQQLSIIPDSSEDDNGQLIGKVGIMPTLDASLLMQNSYIKNYSIFGSIGYAYNSCVNLMQTNLTMLSYMLQGKVSWHNIGGPVSIAKASQNAMHQGVKAFVDLLALISLSLAVMNLLPIPMLDGGHIVLYALEWLTGKKISNTTQQFLFKIGLIAILTISGLALYNDFLKLLNL